MNKEAISSFCAFCAHGNTLIRVANPRMTRQKCINLRCEFDLSHHPRGINNRDDLIQTIIRWLMMVMPMISWLISDMASLFPWRVESINCWWLRGWLPKPIRCQTMCAVEKGNQSTGLCSNGVSVTRSVCSTTGWREFMAAIARLCTSSPLLSQLDALFSAYSLGRLYWQSSGTSQRFATRALTLYKYVARGRIFETGSGRSTLCATPQQPLTVQPECPVTLRMWATYENMLANLEIESTTQMVSAGLLAYRYVIPKPIRYRV